MIKYSEYTGNKRNQYMKLLLIGDEDESKVSEYINQGFLFLAKQDGEVMAVAILIPTSNSNVCELKNIAVHSKFQGKGIGSGMINYILEQISEQYKSILVGTGDADVQNILFYLKSGFRFLGIKKDFFDGYSNKIVSNGVALKDMVLLTRTIKNN